MKSKKGRGFVYRIGALLAKNAPSTPLQLEQCFVEENKRRPFSEGELSSLSGAITLAMIQRVAEQKNSEERARCYANSLSILQSCEKIDWVVLYEKLSALHKALMANNVHRYRDLDDTSRAFVRHAVIRYAKRHRVSQGEAAGLFASQKPKPNIRRRKVAALSLFLGIFAVLFTAVLLFCPVFAAPLLLLPMAALALEITESVLMRYLPPIPILSLRPGPIPDNAKTLVVITALLNGSDADDRLFDRLATYYHRNKDKNLRFGILCDLPEGQHAHKESDEVILEKAKRCLADLKEKHGDHFVLFVRRRSRSASEGCYIGWERKRGALIELCRAARKKSHSFSHISDSEESLRRFRYVITLDADTELSMGMASELVFTMLHPENKPVIKNKVVVSGYGILQPRMIPSLSSASRTPFSVLQTGSGGRDSYADAAGDFDQNTFGKGIFCGKGIFDIDTFLAVLDGTFPTDCILSHDLPEGSRLRCGALYTKSFTDGVPASVISFHKRQHRWLRGDVQNLIFAFSRHKNEKNEWVDNPIDSVGRFQILRNILFLLRPIFCFLSLVFALFLPSPQAAAVLFFSTLHLLYPFVRGIFHTACHANRHYYSNVLQGLWHSLCNMLYSISSLAENALLNLDALIRSGFRMTVSRRHLLQWVTADHAEQRSKHTLLGHALFFWKSIVTGLLFLWLAPNGLFILFGLATISLPVLAFWLTRPFRDKKTLRKEDAAELTDYAKDAFSYYETFVDKENHYLPPDNYQYTPVAALASRTSPTNIGMYLLSLLAAVDLSFLTPKEFHERLERTVPEIQSLAKFRGHLYNWYDTKTKEVIGAPYISTVDSGNFIVALVTLKNGIGEYIGKEPALAKWIPALDKLINDCDFSFLYNKSRHLFCIGYDTVKGSQDSGCYDLFMSECRTTSYYCIAKGIVEKEHWRHLGRPLVKSEGYMGMASWSGTAFEFFMPALLLPTPKNSLSYECLGYALYEQAHDDSHGIWGRSESGYYAFDDDMNYQYRAFGVHTLSLDIHSQKNDVIAPYASFLMLPLSISMPLSNLRKMKKMGMYGPHGFYEAIDFTPARVGMGHGIVGSYMAHHVGMTIVAVANALKKDVFVDRFLLDPDLDAARELLEERVPVDAAIPRKGLYRLQNHVVPKRILLPKEVSLWKNDRLPACAALLCPDMSLFAGASGDVSVLAGKVALTYPVFDSAMPLKGLRLLVNTDKGVLDLLNIEGGKFGRNDTSLVYEGLKYGIRHRTAFTLCANMPFVSISLWLSGSFKTAEPMLLSEVILHAARDYLSHPNYTSLFIECRYHPEDNALVFLRRPKKEKEKPLAMIVTMEGGGFEFVCRRDSAYGGMYGEEDVQNLFEKTFDCKDGQCILPFFAIRRSSTCPGGKFTAEFLIGTGEDANELLRSVRKFRGGAKGRIASVFAPTYKQFSENRMLFAGLTQLPKQYEQFIVSSILYDTKMTPTRAVNAERDLFWRHGISTDRPILSLFIADTSVSENVKGILVNFLRTKKYLDRGGFFFDLILFYEERDTYASPVRNALTTLITECVGEGMMGKKGGVYLICDPQTLEGARYFSSAFLTLDKNSVASKLFADHFAAHSRPERQTVLFRPSQPSVTSPRPLLSLSSGAFTNEGYRVYKNRTRQVQSRIYCSHQFGTLVTQNSLGVTFFRNAGEFSLTKRRPDPLLDTDGERLLVKTATDTLDLCAMAHTVDFDFSNARYEGEHDGLLYEVLVGCDAKFPVKLVLLTLTNRGTSPIKTKVSYKVIPDLGGSRVCYQKKEGNTLFFRSLDASHDKHMGFYLAPFDLPAELRPGQSHTCHFLLGVIHYQNDRSYYAVTEKFKHADSVRSAFLRYKEAYEPYLSKFRLSSPSPALDLMFNRHIPYQALTSRIFARTGFYQTGGAYGFRDQLQDCMNLLPIDATLLRRQLLRCAVHQYAEGDVQHWWHEGGEGARGMRTHCSDDLLWMPLALAEYVEQTGDAEFMKTRLPYLISRPLEEKEDERYETAAKSHHKESLVMHCMRAIDLALTRMGDKGLPLMGSGDWNDGMNLVGKDGKGQSVWLGMFLVLVLEKFSDVCLTEKADKERYLKKAKELRKVLLQNCFEEDRFLRAFFDDGTPLGSKQSPECQIDLLPQAFSAFLFRGDPKARTAMESAKRYLYDENTRTMRLFTPPFDESVPNPGYIRGYLPGIRENGGQYTHAAMWGAIAFFTLGMKEEGYAVLCGSNPAARCLIPSLASNYRLEPYAIAADIYSAEHAGRGGWSQYTGAAGWFFRAVLCGMIGYQRKEDQIALCPKLPEALSPLCLQIKEGNQVICLDCTDGREETVTVHSTQNAITLEK